MSGQKKRKEKTVISKQLHTWKSDIADRSNSNSNRWPSNSNSYRSLIIDPMSGTNRKWQHWLQYKSL